MAWEGDFPIKISGGGVPKSTRGPTLASVFNTLFMAYQGEGGKKLYLSQSDGSTGQFGEWTGNKQVVSSSGKHLETRDRPSIYIPVLSPSIIFADHASGNLMQTNSSGGGAWTDPEEFSDFASYGNVWRSPLISVVGLKSVLFTLDHKNNPWYTFQVFQWDISSPNFGGVSPWVGARPFPRSVDREEAEVGTLDWFATIFTNPATKQLIETVYGVSRTAIHVYQSPLVYDPQNEEPWVYAGSIDFANARATITSTAAGAMIVFSPSKSSDLFGGIVQPDTMTVAQVVQIQGGGGQFVTDQSPHIILFQSFRTPSFNALCLAYKQNGGHDLSFGFEPV